jgi:hypothetical protein
MDELVLWPPFIGHPFPRRAYFTWTRYPGVFYRIETSTDLRNWQSVPGAGYPNGPNLYSIDFPADSPATFYRVIARRE